MARTRREPRMHRHRGAGFVLSVYEDLPARSLLLKAVVRAEGGQMFSRTLRDVLTRHHGVDVGDFSYGSLLVPGFADVGTRIGRYVSIGPNVRRIGAAHPVEHPSMHPFWYNPSLGMVDSTSDVVRSGCDIGHDSWIGANAVILPNCSRIGTGAVIGAGSVVTRDIPDFAIAAGNPARVLRQRFTDAVTARVLDARPWDLSPADARSVLSDLGLSTEKSADHEDDGAARTT